MSAQPAEPVPGTPSPAPSAAAAIRAQIEQTPERDRWLPAFDRDWRRALEDARETFTLAPAHRVIRDWQGRLAAAPDVRAFAASGYDDSNSIPLDEVLGSRG